MPWVKLDDSFFTNPKAMLAGIEARSVYLAGLCYCAAGLTDGFVPAEALGKIAALADVRKPAAAATRLVSIGLWESVQHGYRVHDYLKYQPSADDVRKERERVAEWRTKRSTERVPNSVQNTVRNGVPDAYGTASTRDDVPARPVPGLRNSVNGVPKEPCTTSPQPPPQAAGAAPHRRNSRRRRTAETEPILEAMEAICPSCGKAVNERGLGHEQRKATEEERAANRGMPFKACVQFGVPASELQPVEAKS